MYRAALSKKHGPPAAEPDDARGEPAADAERRPTNNSSQKLDRRSDAASAESESDADEEDNGDTDLVIDSLLPEDPPSGRVSPDPDAAQPAAELEEFLERLRSLAVGGGEPQPRAAAGDEPCPPQTAPARPASPTEPAAPPASRVPLVGGDARRRAPVEQADRARQTDGSRAPPDGRPVASAAPEKAPGGASPQVSEEPEERNNSAPVDICMEKSSRGADWCADTPSTACAGAEASTQDGPSPTPVNSRVATLRPTQSRRIAWRLWAWNTSLRGTAVPPPLRLTRRPPVETRHRLTQRREPTEVHRRCDWLSRALTTLAPQYQAAAGECSLLMCLNQYTVAM